MAEYVASLNSAESDNETSWYKSFGAGLVSGLIKIPEGVVSLGAELVDLGADSNTAADVEQFFDKINPFEEIAEENTIGKLTEAIMQIAVPGGIGFKVASTAARKMTTKALKAKRNKAYADFGKGDKFYKANNPLTKGTSKGVKVSKNYNRDNLTEALDKVNKLNKGLKKPRFAAAVLGGAAGETLVVDNDAIGTFGDMFEGPTSLDRDSSLSGSDDAARKLMNRFKFGGESIFATPVAYGIGKTAKLLANRGADLAYSNSAFERWIDKYIRAAFSPRGALPAEVFAKEMEKQGLKVKDTYRAKEIVSNITKITDSFFPTVQEVADKTVKTKGIDKLSFSKELNNLLVSGDLSKGIDEKAFANIISKLNQKGIGKKQTEALLTSLSEGRAEFNTLLNILNKNSKGIKRGASDELKDLFKNRLDKYVGHTYQIFEHRSNIFNAFRKYKPTDESYKNAINVFTKNGTRTEQEARSIVDDILRQAEKVKSPKDLPDFKYISKTMEKGGSKEVFKIGLKSTSKGSASEKQALKQLFGQVEDPRFTLFNGISNLSNIARTADYIGQISLKNDQVQAKGGRGFFWKNEAAAKEAVNSGETGIEVVRMSEILGEIDATKNIINPLNAKWTTKEIGEAIKFANDIPTTFQGFVRGDKKMSGPEAGVSWFYRNLLMFPKGVSQMAKTIFSIPTHIRNFMSAGAFSAANGIIPFALENPKTFAKAFRRGIGESGLLKLGGVEAGTAANQRAYRDMLELGITNSQVQLGDMTSLIKDSAGGKNLLNNDYGLSRMFKKFKKIGEFFQGKYMAEDDTFKITNFVVELDRIVKATAKSKNMTVEAYENSIGLVKGFEKIKNGIPIRNEALWKLKQEAAEIVKNTVPNYAYVGQAVKTARLLPIGNFMSFPSEIIRTTTNIARQGVKELSHVKGEGVVRIKGSNIGLTVTEVLKDGSTRVVKNNAITNGTYGTGMKRIAGMATTLTAVPVAVTEGAKALYDVTEDEIDAMRRFVPDWSKNSTLVPIRDDDGELSYIDFSKSNAYDLMARPFRTLMSNIQEGQENGDTLLEGFTAGVGEASGEIMNPFISESIWTEAMADLVIRGGRTSEGRQLYTDQTPLGDKMAIQFMHLGNALAPSYKQGLRIGQASFGIPDKRGNELEIGPELAGFMGFRPVKIDPLDAMNFKIAGYQTGIRNARREFTGGFFGLLKGGSIDDNDVVSRYIKSNKARFEVQKEMFRDLEAAQELGNSSSELRKVFKERQLSGKTFNNLNKGRFEPYYPSKDIIKKFKEISLNLGEDNAFLSARGDLNSIKRDLKALGFDERFRADFAVGGHVESTAFTESMDNITTVLAEVDFDMQNLNLEEEFDDQIDINEYITKQEVQTPMLPQTPMPNQNVIQASVKAQATEPLNEGLTNTENALLSQEEKMIRLRQRGLA